MVEFVGVEPEDAVAVAVVVVPVMYEEPLTEVEEVCVSGSGRVRDTWPRCEGDCLAVSPDLPRGVDTDVFIKEGGGRAACTPPLSVDCLGLRRSALGR